MNAKSDRATMKQQGRSDRAMMNSTHNGETASTTTALREPLGDNERED